MKDTTWDELLRSPLDPDPNKKTLSLGWFLPTVLAVLAGLAVGFLLGETGSGASVPTSIGTLNLTTTVTTPPIPDPILPAGYTDVGAVGLKAVASYSDGESLLVVITQAVRSDKNTAETDSLHFAKWTLVGDGYDLDAVRSISSIVAPGTRTVVFPGLNAIPSANPHLVVRQATPMQARTGCNGCAAVSQDINSGEVALEQLTRPLAINNPLLINVGDGITLSLDELNITDEWGYSKWHLIDNNDAIARVSLVVRFDGTDDPAVNGSNPTRLVPAHLFGISQQRPLTTNPESFVRSGSVSLDRIGEPISEENQPGLLVLEWTVEWQHPVGDPITIPLSDLTDFGIID